MRWTTDREIELLRRYARNSKLGVVEIGTFDGDTAAEMASVTRNKVYTIDPVIPDSMPPHDVGNLNRIDYNTLLHDNLIFIQNFSYLVFPNFDKEFDFLFIDGSHLYEDVKKDFEDWFTKLSQGGYVAFHDCAPTEDGRFGGWPGPTQFVNELSLPLIERVDTIKVFIK